MTTENLPNENKICLESLDRLSNLPPMAIDAILKRIPIKQAVRTSVLSKKWRFKWTSLSDLVFDSCSIPYAIKYMSYKDPILVRFVNYFFKLHSAMVSRFEMNIFLDSGCPDLDQWILSLVSKSVQQFILRLGGYTKVEYDVPSTLFSCQYLNLLKLKDCVLKFPSDAKGFKLLTVLELHNVTFTDETIASLTSTSPLLKDLSMDSCIGFTRISISAPSLTKIVFKGCCGDITFDNTLKLVYAKMEITKRTAVTRNNGEHKLEDVLAGLINIQKLSMSQYFMEILADRIVPERLSFTYDSLPSIELSMNFKDPKVVSTALCFFKSSTSLEEMKIESSYNEAIGDSDTWKQHQHLEKFIFPKLKTVKLDEFKGEECELGFIKFILKTAVVLETLKVEWECGPWGLEYTDDWYDTRLDALKTVNQFPRASPTAQVIFK